jgi:hypothetical protein
MLLSKENVIMIQLRSICPSWRLPNGAMVLLAISSAIGPLAEVRALAQTVRVTPLKSATVATSATSVPEGSTGFQAFTWSANQPAATAHVTGLVHVYPGKSLDEVASELKGLPPGKRYLIIQNLTEDLATTSADQCVSRTWKLVTRSVLAPVKVGTSRVARSKIKPTTVVITERVPVDTLTGFRGPWMDKGTVAVRARIDALFAELKRKGAEIDCVSIDNETWLHAASFLGHPGALSAIENDPRWPALAASSGLPLVVSDMTWGSEKYFLWTERMSGRFDAALNIAVFAPMRRYYPKASSSQYMSGTLKAQYATPDVNGHLDRRQTAGFGTHDNSEFYGWSAAGRMLKCGGTSTDPSWLALRVEVHKIRGINASSVRPKHAWIACKSWEGETYAPVAFANSPMWDEVVLQLGMHGVRRFFELAIEDYSISRAANLAKRTIDRAALEANLSELDRRLGSSSSESLIISQPTWNDQVLATGCRIGDRCIWRFSFAPTLSAVKVQMSDGSVATVTKEAGRDGAWFEHPATVRPITALGSALPSLELVATEVPTGPNQDLAR